MLFVYEINNKKVAKLKSNYNTTFNSSFRSIQSLYTKGING